MSCAPRTPTVTIGPAVSRDRAPESPEPLTEEAPSSDPGCVFGSDALYSHNRGIWLCFHPDGPCFGHLSASFFGDVVLELPAGDPKQLWATVDLESDGVALRARTDATEAIFYANQPIVLGGIAIPVHGGLDIARVDAGNVDLVAAEDSRIRLLQGPLRGRVACNDIGLKLRIIEMEEIYAALGVVSQLPKRERLLPEGTGVQLSAEVDGPAIVEITAMGMYDSSVEIVQQVGARSRILWSSGSVVYLGWVDTAALSTGEGGGIIGLLGGPSPSSLRPGPAMRCPKDVPLMVKALGVAGEVGVIRGGTLFGTEQRLKEGMSVVLATKSYVLEPGGKWVVPLASLKGCVAEQSGPE